MKPLNAQVSPLVLLTAISLCATLVQTSPGHADWLDDVRLTYDSAASQTSPGNGWCVAADTAGNLCTVWTDLREGQLSVYCKHYDGAAWTADERLSDESAPSDQPSIAGDALGNFHVVWTDYESGTGEVYYRKYDGTSWQPPERLTTDPANSLYPVVAADDSGHVHVVWQEYRDGDWEVYYKCFDGTSWGADTRLTASAGISGYPCIAVDAAGHLHVVWHDSREGNYEIYYKLFDGAWGEDQRLTVAAGVSGHPSIAADGLGNLHVVWEDERNGSYQIFHKMYDGVAWGSDELLSSVAEGSTSPSVAADDSGHVHVVWQAAGPLLAPLTTEIYYRFFNGVDWDPELRLTNAYDASDYASVCLNPRGDVHVVWQDARDGNFEIYWKWAFTSPLPRPEVFSITPDSCDWNSIVHITDLAGDHFLGAASVWLQMAGQSDVIASNVTVLSPIQITCDFDLTGAPSGWWDVVIENPDAQKDTLVAGFWVIPLPTPEITSITPDSGYWDTVVHITDLAGDHFLDGASVWLQMAGESDLIGSDVTVLSPVRITCDFDLTGVAGGSWDVVVENPDAQKDTLAGAFWVGPFPKPEIFSIEPDSGYWDTVVHITDLAGDHFRDGASVWLQMMGQSDLIASNVTVLSSAQITCDFDLTGVAGGSWDVVVENADAQKDTLVAGFCVGPFPKPEIFSITPDSGYWDTVVHITDLAGDHFRDSASVWLQMMGQSDLIASNVTVFSSTQITCDFDLTGAPFGLWDVVVENPDAQKDTLAEGFRVIPVHKPEIFSITPDSGYWDTVVHITDLAGDHFLDGASVWLQMTGEPDLIAYDVTVLSPAQITCDFDLTGIAEGLWDVVVENLDTQKDTLAEGFRVIPMPKPEITSIEPDSGYWDTIVHVTDLAGNHFFEGAQVRLQKAGEDDIEASNTTVLSSVQITCDLDLTGAAEGWWHVIVENPDAQLDTLLDGFRVMPWPKPEVISIEPDSSYPLYYLHITDLAGNHFFDGAQVRLQKTGEDDIEASNVIVVSSSQITCDFCLWDAAGGWWDVVVENLDAQKDTLVEGYQIVPRPIPEITSIEPDSGYWNSVVGPATITGSGFMSLAWVWLQKLGQPKIDAYDVTIVSPNEITCYLDLTGAAWGWWDVVVTNVGGTRDTLVAGFRVVPWPKPEIASITPDSAYWYSTVDVTDLTGDHFVDGASVWLQMMGQSDVIGSDVTVLSPAQITCDFDLTGVAEGLWDVVVRNVDTQKDTLVEGFRVIPMPKPEITSIEPDSGYWCTVVHITDLAGDHFFDGASVWLQMTGLPDVIASDVIVLSPAQITCDFDLTGVAEGLWDVVVENPDAQKDTLVEGFQVMPRPKPEISSIDPGSWPRDHRIIADIYGSGFFADTQVWLQHAGECDIYPSDIIVVSPVLITCDLDLAAAALGYWDVVAQSPCAPKDTLDCGFLVLAGLWDDEIRLTLTPEASSMSRANARCIAVDGSGNAHVVWWEDQEDRGDIYYRGFDGVEWGPEWRLALAYGSAGYPSIAADSENNLHVVWEDDRFGDTEISYKKYDGAWCPLSVLTNAGGLSSFPSIAVGPANSLHVVWQDNREGDFEIYYKSHDGESWTTDQRLTVSTDASILPTVAVDGSCNVHVAWLEYRGAASDTLLYMNFDGVTWGPPVALDTAAILGAPSMAAYGDDNLCITWHASHSTADEMDIYFRRYDGITWQPKEMLTTASGSSHDASVAVDDSGLVYVVWSDNRSGNDEIYFKRFDGIAWEPDTRLTNVPYHSRHPSAALGPDGDLHVAWSDSRHGNYEIYYRKRNPGELAGVGRDDVDKDRPLTLGVFPNPVKHGAKIEFCAATQTEAVISVYDISGRLVWKHNMGLLQPGQHNLKWPCTDSAGKRVSAGVYFLSLKIGASRAGSKIVVLK